MVPHKTLHIYNSDLYISIYISYSYSVLVRITSAQQSTTIGLENDPSLFWPGHFFMQDTNTFSISALLEKGPPWITGLNFLTQLKFNRFKDLAKL